jgi:PTS system nitrogen regulatory IIA component
MKLTIRQAAEALAVSEQTILRWVRDEALPAARVNEQLRFNRGDVLEWATARGKTVASDIFPDTGEDESTIGSFAAALEYGGIHVDVGGTDVASVLRAVVDVMHLPQDADREAIYEVMLAREALGSTGIGDGIAIPHVRRPLVLNTAKASIALCFLAHPSAFGAFDGQPITTVFSFVTPTSRVHLKLLARLSAALHDDGFRQALRDRASADHILAEARRAEDGFAAKAAVGRASPP